MTAVNGPTFYLIGYLSRPPQLCYLRCSGFLNNIYGGDRLVAAVLYPSTIYTIGLLREPRLVEGRCTAFTRRAPRRTRGSESPAAIFRTRQCVRAKHYSNVCTHYTATSALTTITIINTVKTASLTTINDIKPLWSRHGSVRHKASQLRPANERHACADSMQAV